MPPREQHKKRHRGNDQPGLRVATRNPVDTGPEAGKRKVGVDQTVAGFG